MKVKGRNRKADRVKDSYRKAIRNNRNSKYKSKSGNNRMKSISKLNEGNLTIRLFYVNET
jgi:hypothetical protein